jgi:taurine dioxygenase
MLFNVAPLPGQSAFGAVITGLSPDSLDDPVTRKALYDVWVDKGVIVFQGLTALDSQLKLSDIFGQPEIHPLLVGIDRPREHKFIADIEYDQSDGDLYEIDGEPRGGWLPWHFDLAYVDRINHGGILRPDVLPRHGGETGFIDRIAAYATLPQKLRDRIETLNVIYKYKHDSSKAKFGQRPDKAIRLSSKGLIAEQHPAVQGRVIHPLVYTQAETGRKVLNLSPWFAEGIEGMETPQGDQLLEEIVSYAVQPNLAYYHRWQPNDMVLWDNWRMLHCACGVPPGEVRRMRRTTIAGDYALGRREVSSSMRLPSGSMK